MLLLYKDGVHNRRVAVDFGPRQSKCVSVDLRVRCAYSM